MIWLFFIYFYTAYLDNLGISYWRLFIDLNIFECYLSYNTFYTLAGRGVRWHERWYERDWGWWGGLEVVYGALGWCEGGVRVVWGWGEGGVMVGVRLVYEYVSSDLYREPIWYIFKFVINILVLHMDNIHTYIIW